MEFRPTSTRSRLNHAGIGLALNEAEEPGGPGEQMGNQQRAQQMATTAGSIVWASIVWASPATA